MTDQELLEKRISDLEREIVQLKQFVYRQTRPYDLEQNDSILYFTKTHPGKYYPTTTTSVSSNPHYNFNIPKD